MADQKPDTAEPKVTILRLANGREQFRVSLDASGHIPDAALEQVWELLTPEAREALCYLIRVGIAYAEYADRRADSASVALTMKNVRAAFATLRLGGIK